MKFISLCDTTGIIEYELFAGGYKCSGAETMRYPVIEIVGKMVPFANENGHTLAVRQVGSARRLSKDP